MLFLNYVPKAAIKGVFSRSYCCYGNLLCYGKGQPRCSQIIGQCFEGFDKTLTPYKINQKMKIKKAQNYQWDPIQVHQYI